MGRARERQWPLCTERERNIMRLTERDRPSERERDSDRDRGRERERQGEEEGLSLGYNGERYEKVRDYE